MIHNYEMRLPQLIKESGLKTGVYIDAQDMGSYILQNMPNHPRIIDARVGQFTMTHDFWEETITRFRCPALKVELLRDNPLGIDLSGFCALFATRPSMTPSLSVATCCASRPGTCYLRRETNSGIPGSGRK